LTTVVSPAAKYFAIGSAGQVVNPLVAIAQHNQAKALDDEFWQPLGETACPADRLQRTIGREGGFMANLRTNKNGEELR
jgi:hypothetical protein